MLFAFLLLLAGADFEATFRSGLVALQRGDLPAAQSDLQQAATLQPNNGRVWVALAQTYWKLHQSAKADDAALKAATLGANDDVVRRTLALYYVESAQSLMQRQQFAEAITLLREAAGRLGKNAQMEMALGVAYYGQRRFSEAADQFFTAIALAPEVKQPYVFLGKMLDQIPDRLEQATNCFIAFEKANPSDYEGYLLHAKALNARSAEPGTARKLLEKAIAINGNDASAHAELAALLDRQHLFAAAAAEFEQAAALDPADPTTHYRLSRVYERLGRTQAAAAERQRHRELITARDAAR